MTLVGNGSRGSFQKQPAYQRQRQLHSETAAAAYSRGRGSFIQKQQQQPRQQQRHERMLQYIKSIRPHKRVFSRPHQTMGAVAGGGQDHGKKGDAHDDDHPVRKLADMGSKSMRRHLHPSSFSLIFFVALLLCILDKTRLLVSSLTKLFNFSFLFSFSDILLSASSLDLPPNISLPLVFPDFSFSYLFLFSNSFCIRPP
jgi:hypothetical protein